MAKKAKDVDPAGAAPAVAAASGGGGRDVLGITAKKSSDFPEWYTQVITRAEMVEYYDVSGCYILRPWSFFIWEQVQEFMNARIRAMGVRNAYFPMFVSKSRLEAEAAHIAGFSPEVAWVTRYGSSDLAEPIAIRPTSETIMYPAFARWVRSHRDLPLRLNQWAQVVRWEFKQPTPFIRTREFLWQEGHTAHATDAEACAMVDAALALYKEVYEKLLAVPVVRGRKSEKEKFAGAKYTTTVETAVAANGRGIQAATSHHLGTNFSEMFNIQFEDAARQKQFAHQTSWGLSTRSLGVLVMVHGDDKGMVMPPRVAPLQLVVIPIVFKENDSAALLDECRRIEAELCEAIPGLRTHIDDREGYKPGWKYNHWEVRGVPIRLELGPRDVQNKTARLVRRDDGQKIDVPQAQLSITVQNLLQTIQEDMLARATGNLRNMMVRVERFDQVPPALNAKKIILAPWCGENEGEITKLTTVAEPGGGASIDVGDVAGGGVGSASSAGGLTGGMKTLCIPLDVKDVPLLSEDEFNAPESFACFFDPAKRATCWALWGRSY